MITKYWPWDWKWVVLLVSLIAVTVRSELVSAMRNSVLTAGSRSTTSITLLADRVPESEMTSEQSGWSAGHTSKFNPSTLLSAGGMVGATA